MESPEDKNRKFAEDQAAAYERLGLHEIAGDPGASAEEAVRVGERINLGSGNVKDPSDFLSESGESERGGSTNASEEDHINEGRGGEWKIDGDSMTQL